MFIILKFVPHSVAGSGNDPTLSDVGMTQVAIYDFRATLIYETILLLLKS